MAIEPPENDEEGPAKERSDESSISITTSLSQLHEPTASATTCTTTVYDPDHFLKWPNLKWQVGHMTHFD